MSKGRLEAFSDGVIAIIITIMVLELKVPHGSGLAALQPLIPVLSSYLLSFIYIGIYWNNHHHLFQAAQKVTGGVLWANLHLLFWLSLTPVATAWLGDHPFTPWPVALYGSVLLLASIAYYILTRLLIAHHGKESVLARSIGNDRKGKLSSLGFAIGIPLSFALPRMACLCYVLVAIVWLIPDRRIEKQISTA